MGEKSWHFQSVYGCTCRPPGRQWHCTHRHWRPPGPRGQAPWSQGHRENTSSTQYMWLVGVLHFRKQIKFLHAVIKIVLAATLTLSVPGRHGDDPVDSSFSHGAYHGAHWLGVSRHGIEHGGWEAETGHDHILPFEMSLQAARRENVCFHHLEAADGKEFCMHPSMIHLTPEIKLRITFW